MIFLTAGHNRKDSGAVYAGRKEADETIKLRNAIIDILNKKTLVWKDEDDWDLNKTIKEIKGASSANDIICDLHFNAGPAAATGCEVYIPDAADEVEKALANELATSISSVLMIKNRGVHSEARSQHKRLGMMRPAGRNVLIEICFISNKYDMEAYDRGFQLLVERISDILLKAHAKLKN